MPMSVGAKSISTHHRCEKKKAGVKPAVFDAGKSQYFLRELNACHLMAMSNTPYKTRYACPSSLGTSLGASALGLTLALRLSA